MSSLRGRTRDSSWQWLVIGLFLGLGCSGVTFLGLYATGTMTLNMPGSTQAALGPTVVTVIVTGTPPPATPTSLSTTPPTGQPTTDGGTPGTPSKTPYTIIPSPTSPPNSTPATPAGTDIPQPTQTPAPPATQGAGGGATGTPLPGGPTLAPTITQTEMVEVQGGVFTMGTTPKEATQAVVDCTSRDKGQCKDSDADDSRPTNNVTLNTYLMEKYEMSFEQYIQFLNFIGPNSHLNGCGGQQCAAINTQVQASYIKFDGVKYDITNPIYLTRPVFFVTWFGADSYCKAIGRRLPTEAEWEHAARGTANSIYPWGDTWDPAKAITSRSLKAGAGSGPVDVTENSAGASQFGIYNMAGNVAEWVNDWYDPNWYKNPKNFENVIGPKGPASGTTKVVRGGSYAQVPFFARSVHRTDHAPNKPEADIGFRCAADKQFGQSNSSGGSGTSGSTPPTAVVPSGGGVPTATKDVLAPGSQ